MYRRFSILNSHSKGMREERFILELVLACERFGMSGCCRERCPPSKADEPRQWGAPRLHWLPGNHILTHPGTATGKIQVSLIPYIFSLTSLLHLLELIPAQQQEKPSQLSTI